MKTTVTPTSRASQSAAAVITLLALVAFVPPAQANEFQGTGAGGAVTTGVRDTGFGDLALDALTSGNDNTAVGESALTDLTIGNQNTAVGSSALENTTANRNTAVGANALEANTTGTENTGIGVNALDSNVTGSDNVALGNAADNNTDGNKNVGIGNDALDDNTSGSNNIAVGDNSLAANELGNNNIAVGVQALTLATADNNTAIGTLALAAATTGDKNVALGTGALDSVTTGVNNIGIGFQGGANVAAGSNNIEIGAAGAAADNNTIRIGRQNTQLKTIIAGIRGSAVNGQVVTVNAGGRLGVQPSSARFKKQIQPMAHASEDLLKLHPVTFRYNEEVDADGTPQFGLVAEEVEKVNPELVSHDEDGKPFTVRYDAVNAMLLNEFLKAKEQIAAQQQRIERLEALVGSR